MLSTLRKISVLNKLFNVRGNEWSRVRLAWFLRFAYRFGFVMGWTVLLVLFVGGYGIKGLPILFILNGIFTIIGSFFYATLLEYFERSKMMVATTALSSFILFLIPSLYHSNQVLFFGILIPTVSILMMQLSVMILGFIEDMFSSIESERTFPLIESAETIGGVFGGLLIVALVYFLEPYQLIYIWAITNLMIIPIVFYRKSLSHYDEVQMEGSDEMIMEHGLINRVKESLKSKHLKSYIGGLFALVFLQWFIFVILDYQYTSAIYDSVEGVIMDSSGLEHAFIESLGGLNILFYGAALVMQLFFASRMISYLGVVGAMTMHAIVTFISMIGLLLNFNFVAAIVVRNNFTMTSIVNTSSYHSSYYAIRERFRVQLRQVLEGVVRPLGAVFGTLMIFLINWIFTGIAATTMLTIMMMCAAMFMIIFNVQQKKRYTEVALSDLKKSKILAVRFNAVDVLAQKGHEDILNELCLLMKNNEEHSSLRVRTALSLSKSEQISTIPAMLELLESEDYYLKESIFEALSNFDFLKKPNSQRLFLKAKIVNSLKRFYKSDNSAVLRAKALRLMSKMGLVATTDFLLYVLRSNSDVDKIQVLNLLSKIEDKDYAEHVEEFLDSKSSMERIHAAIALFEIEEFLERALGRIEAALTSKQKNVYGSALFAVGELGLNKYRDECHKALASKDEFVKMNAILSLLKLGEKHYVPDLVEFLFTGDPQNVEFMKFHLEDFDSYISSSVNTLLKEQVFVRIKSIMKEQKVKSVHEFEKSQLQTLLWFYKLIGEYDEVEVINDIISKL